MSKHHPHSPKTDVPKAPVNRETLGELWHLFAYLRPYRGRFFAAWTCLLISSAMALTIPYFGGRLIDGAQRSLAAGESAAADFGGLNTIALSLFVVVAIRATCNYLQSLWGTEVGERTMADLRRDTFNRIIHLPMSFFAQRRVGELTSRIAADLSQIQGTLTGSIPQFLGQLVTLLGGIALISLTSGKLTIIVLLMIPLLVFSAMMFGRKARKLSRDSQDRLADTAVVVEESLQGIATVKAFAREEFEGERYAGGMRVLIEAAMRSARHMAMFGGFMTFAGMGSMIIVLWYGCRLIQTGELTVGNMTQFMMYAMFVGGAAGQFARLYGDLQRMLGATQRVRELLKEPTEPGCEFESLRAAQSEKTTHSLPRVNGDVSFEEVEFAYPSRKEVTVLNGLTLTASAGQRVALVGPSGSGKSTIVSLLMRFYDPDSGRVIIDGKDARDYPLRPLREQMAIVPQDVLLFGGTIAENIAYGRQGATQAEIEDAARQANAHDFISGFPEGYQTVVGERGVKLSGGQRQRVAIARAVLRDPAILILDEATSSLDSESESLVQQALESLMEGRTSIIIAHRLSTIRRADCIYVIREGTVVEAGTHEELLGQSEGLYRSLSELQFEMSPGERGALAP